MITISPSSGSAGLVGVIQDTTVVQVTGVFEGGEGIVRVFAPSVVDASEGEPAVVCFEADFSAIFADVESFQIDLRLTVLDIETSKLCQPVVCAEHATSLSDCGSIHFYVFLLTATDDYDRESIPTNLALNTFQTINCLQIPTFLNIEETTIIESFRVNFTVPATEPRFLPIVIPNGNSVLVRLFEQCVDGDVRLVDSSNTLQGRVQMCYNGVFGYVCDIDGWMTRDAEVVCTQLGHIALPSKLCIL